MRISSFRSGGPASSSRTWHAGSSLRRAASTHPAEPAPTITKSYTHPLFAARPGGGSLRSIHQPRVRIDHVGRCPRRERVDLVEHAGELHFPFAARDVADEGGADDVGHREQRV